MRGAGLIAEMESAAAAAAPTAVVAPADDDGWSHLSRVIPLVDAKDLDRSNRSDGPKLAPIRIKFESNEWVITYPTFPSYIDALVNRWISNVDPIFKKQEWCRKKLDSMWQHIILRYILEHDYHHRCAAYALLCKLLQNVFAPHTRPSAQNITKEIRELMRSSMEHEHSIAVRAIFDSGLFDVNSRVHHGWMHIPFFHAILMQNVPSDVVAAALEEVKSETLACPVYRSLSEEGDGRPATWTPLLIVLNHIYMFSRQRNWLLVERGRLLLKELLKRAWNTNNPWDHIAVTTGSAVPVTYVSEPRADTTIWTPIQFIQNIGRCSGWRVSIVDGYVKEARENQCRGQEIKNAKVGDDQTERFACWQQLKETCHSFMRTYNDQVQYKDVRFTMAQNDLSLHLLPPLIVFVLEFLAVR